MESSSKLIKFESQVAGHDNIMVLPSNDLMVFKPSNRQEREFYEASQQHEEFMDWIPECYGTLRSSTEHEKELLSQGQDVEQVQADHLTNLPTDQLENLDENILSGFTRPCIIDIKLGYKIYEDTADDAKRNKMIKNAEGTTIESLGLRISGMKIFDSVDRHYTTYTKQYGRERTKDNFLDGLLTYFYPTDDLNKTTSDSDTLTSHCTRTKEDQPLDNALAKPIGKKKTEWIVEHFIDTVTDIQGFIEEHAELHLVGCSLLLVYEGDAAAAQRAWKQMLDEDRQHDDYINNKNKSSVNGGNGDGDAEEEETGPKLCDIRLIDFGRSRWQPGRTKQEPSFIKALDNLVILLNQVIEQVP